MIRRTGPTPPSTAAAPAEAPAGPAPKKAPDGDELHRHGPACGCSGFAAPTAAPNLTSLLGERPPAPPPLTPRAWLDKVFGTRPNQEPFADEFEAVRANAQFKALRPELQANLLEELARHEPWSPGRQRVALLVRAQGLGALPTEQAQQLINLIGGTTRTSSFARDALTARLGDDTFWKATPAAQAAALAKFLSDPSSYPPLSAGAPAKLSTEPPVSVRPPVDVAAQPFRTGLGPALRYDVTVGLRSVPVFVPKEAVRAGLHQHSILQVAQALAQLPAGLLARIPFLTLEARPNPGDDGWKKLMPGFKGSYLTADATSVAIHPTEDAQSVDALASALVHEAGHVVSYALWGWSPDDARWTPWKDAIARDGVRPSSYAATRIGEDFSETLRAFHAVRGTPAQAELEALFPARIGVLRQLELV